MADLVKSGEKIVKQKGWEVTKKGAGKVGEVVDKKFGKTAGAIAGAAASGLGREALGFINRFLFGRTDPDIKFAFYVEIDGIQCVKFAECDGIKWEMENKLEFREGGNNLYPVSLPGPTKFQPLKLKKGFFSSMSEFYEWFKVITDFSKTLRKVTLSLVIMNDAGDEVGRFNFYNAYMSSYEGPSFSGGESALAFETIEITYDYFDFMPGDWLSRLLGLALQSGKAALSKMKF